MTQFVLIILLIISLIIIHEVGHIICGLIIGLELRGFYIGKTFFNIKERKIEKAEDFSLAVLMIAKKYLNKLEYTLYLFSGSFLNIIMGIIILSINNSFILELFAMQNIFVGILNLLPIPFDYFSDGMKLYRLHKKETSIYELLDFNILNHFYNTNLINLTELEQLNLSKCKSDYFRYKYRWYYSLLNICSDKDKERLKSEQKCMKVNKMVYNMYKI